MVPSCRFEPFEGPPRRDCGCLAEVSRMVSKCGCGSSSRSKHSRHRSNLLATFVPADEPVALRPQGRVTPRFCYTHRDQAYARSTITGDQTRWSCSCLAFPNWSVSEKNCVGVISGKARGSQAKSVRGCNHKQVQEARQIHPATPGLCKDLGQVKARRNAARVL